MSPGSTLPRRSSGLDGFTTVLFVPNAGDSMTIDVEEPPREVVVRFDEREVIDHG